MTPPTDERPFFFNQLPLYNPLQTLRLALAIGTTHVTSGNLLATVTLMGLFSLSAVLVGATIILPIRPAYAAANRRLVVTGTAYFLLIGVGFMSIEIGLLQRLSVFLGHPIYALSIVLFSMILATGLGSLLSDRVPLETRRRFMLWAVLLGGYLGLLPLWLPALTGRFASATLLVRAILCVMVIAPAGVLMGYGFPTGMRLVSAIDQHTNTLVLGHQWCRQCPRLDACRGLQSGLWHQYDTRYRSAVLYPADTGGTDAWLR